MLYFFEDTVMEILEGIFFIGLALFGWAVLKTLWEKRKRIFEFIKTMLARIKKINFNSWMMSIIEKRKQEWKEANIIIKIFAAIGLFFLFLVFVVLLSEILIKIFVID